MFRLKAAPDDCRPAGKPVRLRLRPCFRASRPCRSRRPTALQGPEQRVALVIGNSNYQHAPQLPNPDNDAQSMAQLLNAAGFEVIAATDLVAERHGSGRAGLLRQDCRPRAQHRRDDLLRRTRRAACGRELPRPRGRADLLP